MLGRHNACSGSFLCGMTDAFIIAGGRTREADDLIYSLLNDLKTCSRRRDLQWGRKIHVKAVESRHDSNIYVVTALIRMYSKCGSMSNARHVFDGIQKPNVFSWTALLLGYAENGDGHATLDLFSKMKASGCTPDSVTYVAAVKACTSLDGCVHDEWLKRGKEIHSEIGCHLNIFVQNTLIDMYRKCGNMADARRVFESIQKPDVVSWTALLMGYAENSNGHAALELFSELKASGCVPDSMTYIAALKACVSLAGSDPSECLKRGREIHSEIGCNLDSFLQNTLIDMYGKCGSMKEAHRVFDGIQNPDVVSWNALLLQYAENGTGLVTLKLFSKMKACRCLPNSVTYTAALKACTSLAQRQECAVQTEWLKWGKEIHSEIGCDMNIFLQSMLIDMYAKFGSMADARRVFDSIPNPDVVSWTALLLGYVENGNALTTMEMFSKMKACECAPNSVTYMAALKACTSLAGKRDGSGQVEWLERGKEIHSEIGSDLAIIVQSTLVEMYSKCDSMKDAHRVFDSIQKPDLISWNALLLGYAENGNGLATLDLFLEMKRRGCEPNSVTYIAALKACTSMAGERDGSARKWLKWGREIHAEIGSNLSIFSQSALIEMYGKFGCMTDARSVFDSIQKPDVVSWTSLLMGYAENGYGLATLDLFCKMKVCGCLPNSVTYIAALKACMPLAEKHGSGQDECLKCGREIHSEIGCSSDIFVQNTIIDMYGKCGSVADARLVFDSIQKPDLVSWNALLLGYADNGDGFATLELFSKMKACKCAPDSVTYIAALKACSLIGALALGRKVHFEISQFNAHLVTCLVHFYAKCGSITEAREVFDAHLGVRDLSTWNALLAGYGSLGDTASVCNLFEAMQDKGFQPDGVTFVCILSCFSHAGPIGKASNYFESMSLKYGITPTLIHYNCMVDILGRGNQLNKAISMLLEMPCKPNEVTWMTLLGACSKWKNVEIGRFAFQSLMYMDHRNASAYVLMAHIYGSRGMWAEQKIVLETRTKVGD